MRGSGIYWDDCKQGYKVPEIPGGVGGGVEAHGTLSQAKVWEGGVRWGVGGWGAVCDPPKG